MRDALMQALRALLISSDQPEETERVLEALTVSVVHQLVQPIETAPLPGPNAEPLVLLLYCPEDGGWHSGVWWNGAWRLRHDLHTGLRPTHWALTPPDPDVSTETMIGLATKGTVRKPKRH